MKKILLIFLIINSIINCDSKAAAQTYLLLVERGLQAVEHDSLPLAEKLFSQAIAADPENYSNALIYSNLAKVQEAQKKYTEALESYNAALKQFPESMPFLNGRGNLLVKMKQYPAAKKDFQAVLKFHPNEYTASMGLATIDIDLERYDEALNTLNLVIVGYPDEPYAYYLRAETEYRTGRYELARMDIDKALELRPNDNLYLKFKEKL